MPIQKEIKKENVEKKEMKNKNDNIEEQPNFLETKNPNMENNKEKEKNINDNIN